MKQWWTFNFSQQFPRALINPYLLVDGQKYFLEIIFILNTNLITTDDKSMHLKSVDSRLKQQSDWIFFLAVSGLQVLRSSHAYTRPTTERTDANPKCRWFLSHFSAHVVHIQYINLIELFFKLILNWIIVLFINVLFLWDFCLIDAAVRIKGYLHWQMAAWCLIGFPRGPGKLAD